MANGFGFCPNCGTPRTVANEKFCAECGTALPPHATPAQPQPQAAPPQFQAAPPPPPSVPPPPTWAAQPQQPPQVQTPVYQTPVYGAQAPAPKSGISPMVALVAVVAIVAAIGGGYVVMNQNKASPSPGAGGLFGSPNRTASLAPTGTAMSTEAPTPVLETPVPPSQGVITFQPASFDCTSTTVQVKISVWLPSTLVASDDITGELDGVSLGTSTLGDTYTQQADGRWFETSTNSAADLCGTGMALGQHNVRILDANDNELARGSFFNTHGGVAPTQTTAGALTLTPSTFSCSSSGQVQLNIVLPASLAGSDQITIKLDDMSSGAEAVEDEFEIQPDGTWEYNDSTSIATICGEVSIGKHTFVIYDALGKVLAQGSFTTQP